MGRHKSESRSRGAPATAEEAAARFLSETGLDLSSDPRLVAVQRHLVTWRVVLAAAERAPMADAMEQADAEIRARAMRPIPKLTPIRVNLPPSEEQQQAQLLADTLQAAMTKLHEGLQLLQECVGLAKASGLVEKTAVGRPEDVMARALCLLLVELVERPGVIERVTSAQAALVAHAYGVAEPTGAWRKWTERWRELMNDARAEQPGHSSVRRRLLRSVRTPKQDLISKG